MLHSVLAMSVGSVGQRPDDQRRGWWPHPTVKTITTSYSDGYIPALPSPIHHRRSYITYLRCGSERPLSAASKAHAASRSTRPFQFILQIPYSLHTLRFSKSWLPDASPPPPSRWRRTRRAGPAIRQARCERSHSSRGSPGPRSIHLQIERSNSWSHWALTFH